MLYLYNPRVIDINSEKMVNFDTMVDIDFMIMEWGREYSLSRFKTVY